MTQRLRSFARHPEAVLAVALLTLPFDTWKFGPAELLSPSNVAFAIAAIALLVSLRGRRTWRASDRWAIAISLLFVVSFIPGAIIAADRAQALRTFVSTIGMGVVFALVILACRDLMSTRFAVIAWSLSGTIASGGAIGQYGLWLAGINVGTAGIAGLCGTPIVTLRAEGFTASANYLSFFVLPVAIASFGLVAERSRASRIGIIAAIACSLTVFLAYSRGALGSLAFAAFLGTILLVFARTRRVVVRITALAVAVVALVLFARLLIGFNQASLVARLNIVDSALLAIGARPISGSGLGSGVPLGSDVSGFCEDVVVITETPSVVATSAPTTVPTSRPVQIPTTLPSVGPGGLATTVPGILSTTVPTTLPTSRPTVAVTEVPVARVTSRPLAATTAIPESDVVARRDTHVTPLQAAYNAGVLGLLGYVLLVAGTLWYGTRRWAARSPLRTALVISAIATQVAGLATDALSIKQMYVGLALLWGVAAAERAERSTPVQTVRPSSSVTGT